VAYSAYCVFATLLSPLAAHYVFRSVVQAAVLKVNAHPLCALVHTRSASCEQLPSSGPIRPYSHSLHVHAECVGDGLPSSVLDDSIGRHSAALRRCGCSIAATFRHHCIAIAIAIALPSAVPTYLPTACGTACGTAQYFVLVVEKHGFPNLNTLRNIWKALWHKDPVAGQALLKYSLSARARSHAPHISCCFEHVLHCDEPCAVRASTPAVLVDAH
jgi:hypothetical protein